VVVAGFRVDGGGAIRADGLSSVSASISVVKKKSPHTDEPLCRYIWLQSEYPISNIQYPTSRSGWTGRVSVAWSGIYQEEAKPVFLRPKETGSLSNASIEWNHGPWRSKPKPTFGWSLQTADASRTSHRQADEHTVSQTLSLIKLDEEAQACGLVFSIMLYMRTV